MPDRRAILRRWLLRLVLVAVLVAAAVLGWRAWSTHWRPAKTDWPMQGVAVGADNAPISWPSLASQGASFAYIDATSGRRGVNPGFTREHDAALTTGLRVGAIHHYALCQMANEQAAAFVTLVPREADALPPAIILDMDEGCAHKPTRALLLSELTTFLTQVETHMGKAAVIAPDAAIEAQYQLTGAINRPLWLRSNRGEPDADGPGWIIWQANDALRVTGSTGLTRWLVLNEGRHTAGDAGESE